MSYIDYEDGYPAIFGFLGAIVIIVPKVICELFNTPMKLNLFGHYINWNHIIASIGIGGLLIGLSLPGFIIGVLHGKYYKSKLMTVLFGLYFVIIVAFVAITIVSAIEAIQMTIASVFVIIGIILVTSVVVIII